MSQWPHASPASDPDDDPSIPLLTDRIFLPAVELDTALPAPPTPVAPAAAATEPAPAPADEAAPAPAAEHAQPSVEAPPAGTEARDTAARVDADATIEAELDRDLVAASDADFEALLSAEPELATAGTPADTTVVEAPPAGPSVEQGVIAAEMQAASPSAAPAIDQAAIDAQGEALRAAVLRRVAARLPEHVNATVRDLMQPAIDQAMAKLGEEAEVALRITLHELVEQALREELARHKGGSTPH
jgi:hypothetical protein